VYDVRGECKTLPHSPIFFECPHGQQPEYFSDDTLFFSSIT
jgi:hypothetical protein